MQCLNILVDDILFRLLSRKTMTKGFWMRGGRLHELHDLNLKQPFPWTSATQNNPFPVPKSDFDWTMLATWEGRHMVGENYQRLALSSTGKALKASSCRLRCFLSSCGPGICRPEQALGREHWLCSAALENIPLLQKS